MIRTFDVPSLAAGSLVGLAAAYVLVPLGVAFLSSTAWFSLGIAAAICAVAAAGYLPERLEPSTRDAFRLPPRNADGTPLSLPSMRPKDWLRQARAFPPVPDEKQQRALIGEALADQLWDNPITNEDLSALDALLDAFGAGRVGYTAFDELAVIMTVNGESRDFALQDFRSRMNGAWGQAEHESNHLRAHHYQEAQILRLFLQARKLRPVRTSDILWLKASHKALWYAFDNTGRRACHVEGLGIIAHYMAERAARTALTEPRLTRAVVALSEYARAAATQRGGEGESLDFLDDADWDGDPDLDFGGNETA